MRSIKIFTHAGNLRAGYVAELFRDDECRIFFRVFRHDSIAATQVGPFARVDEAIKAAHEWSGVWGQSREKVDGPA